MLYNKLAKKVRIRIAPNHIEGLEIGYLLYELSSFSLAMCSVFVRILHERGVFWGYNLNGPYNVRYNRYISLLEKHNLSIIP